MNLHLRWLCFALNGATIAISVLGHSLALVALDRSLALLALGLARAHWQ